MTGKDALITSLALSVIGLTAYGILYLWNKNNKKQNIDLLVVKYFCKYHGKTNKSAQEIVASFTQHRDDELLAFRRKIVDGAKELPEEKIQEFNEAVDVLVYLKAPPSLLGELEEAFAKSCPERRVQAHTVQMLKTYSENILNQAIRDLKIDQSHDAGSKISGKNFTYSLPQSLLRHLPQITKWLKAHKKQREEFLQKISQLNEMNKTTQTRIGEILEYFKSLK